MACSVRRGSAARAPVPASMEKREITTNEGEEPLSDYVEEGRIDAREEPVHRDALGLADSGRSLVSLVFSLIFFFLHFIVSFIVYLLFYFYCF